MSKLLQYKIFCITDQKWEYVWLEEDKAAPSQCPNDTTHEVNIDSVAVENIRESGKVEVTSLPAMAAKTLGDKKLFKRVVGIQAEVVEGDNNIVWVCTFPWVKIMALEIVNSSFLDRISLYVLDTQTGTYSGVPNMPLNQFGFEANIPSGFYKHESEFDADLYSGLQIKIVYHSSTTKIVGINFVMNEVK